MAKHGKNVKRVPPGLGADRIPSKTPRAAHFDTGQGDTPVWQVGDLDLDPDSPFGWYQVQWKDLCDPIIPRVQRFESMTWDDILRTGSHSVRIGDLSADAQKRLVQLRRDDLEHLFSLRLSSRERIWGVREGRILRLLWWDPEHKVYPSMKKHT